MKQGQRCAELRYAELSRVGRVTHTSRRVTPASRRVTRTSRPQCHHLIPRSLPTTTITFDLCSCAWGPVSRVYRGREPSFVILRPRVSRCSFSLTLCHHRRLRPLYAFSCGWGPASRVYRGPEPSFVVLGPVSPALVWLSSQHTSVDVPPVNANFS